jgi:5'-nucleotidase
MKILLTNDDGILSPWLHELAALLHEKAELQVAVPATQQSGVGHAFTFYKPLQIEQAQRWDYPCLVVEGTPADCVKYAVCELYDAKGLSRPDVVISGPNDGENAGVAVIYSGTVAGAREGALWSIPALSLSMKRPSSENFALVRAWIEAFLDEGMVERIQGGAYWNVNFPDLSNQELQGVRISRMSTTMFEDEYVETETVVPEPADSDPLTRRVQLTGYKPWKKFKPESDDAWYRQGYITICPLQVDQTHESEYRRLQQEAPEVFESYLRKADV